MNDPVPFATLLLRPLRSGVTVAARSRGVGIKMLNMGELFRYPRIRSVSMARVTIPDNNPDRDLLEAGDLVFARRSLSWEGAGLCSIVHSADEPTTWESSIIRARVSRQLADPAFYFYYFRSPQGRRQMEGIIEQVAAAGIRLSELAQLQVPLPPLPAQVAIASVLGALDDKIAANAELARTADDLSRALFDRMTSVDNARPLSSIARFTNGKAFTKDASGTGRVVVRIAELNSGLGASTVRSDAVVADQCLARPGEILFAWSGSLTVNRWYRPEAIINQHIFKVDPLDGFPGWVVFHALKAKLSDFRDIAADKATTMGHIQRHHLDNEVPLPAPDEMVQKSGLMTALWDRALAAETESLTLAELRDTLLPHLMSGRLKVRDAEKTVSEAV